MDELNVQLSIFYGKSNQPILLEVFTDADKDAKALKGYWSTNREEIPGMHIDAKSRMKNITRKILGNKTEQLKKILRR